jgi:hypothetical protein
MAVKKQPTPPKKGYTAKDSVNFRRMSERQDADVKKSFLPNVNNSLMDRIESRQDSIVNSPYFKAKAKSSVKNGVTTRILKEPAKPIAKKKGK